VTQLHNQACDVRSRSHAYASDNEVEVVVTGLQVLCEYSALPPPVVCSLIWENLRIIATRMGAACGGGSLFAPDKDIAGNIGSSPSTERAARQTSPKKATFLDGYADI